MKVADLAAELDVPASLILDQCQRFGIDATWAGAELRGADVVVLRAEIASSEPLDLTVPEDPRPSSPSGAGGTTSAIPPTAVGSMPDLAEELTPDADEVPEPPASGDAQAARGPGFGRTSTPSVDPGEQRVKHRVPPDKRSLERGARNSLLALVLAAAAFVASNFTDLAVAVVLLWLVCLVCLCIAIVDGIRGRRRVQTHPERVHGLWLATIVTVLAIGGLVGLTASVAGVISDDPAADAALGVGDLSSVQTARWGVQRAQRLQENGWKQPAREEGSCWRPDSKTERDEDRVELPGYTDLTTCDRSHNIEVARVFSINRDADAPYPSTADLVTAAKAECGPMVDALVAKGTEVQLQIEYPTEVGWNDADHDVACILVTPERDSPLAS